MQHRDVEQLKLDYPDGEWRERFLDLCDLIEVLGDCIIADSYGISDGLNEAVVLSEAGRTVCEKLITKLSVPAKEARLMCALSLGHDELFVDVAQTDLGELAEAISAEITTGRLHFPFIFGRQLYDRYAELHEDEKDSLPPDDTLRLLEPLPTGVFQYGRFAIGPFGLKVAPTSRRIHASRSVPAFHCAQAACRAIHPVVLETSHTAQINRYRDKIDTMLRQATEEAADWWQFAAELGGFSESYYGALDAAVLLPLLGDALTTDELRLLIADLLDTTGGEVRAAVAGFLQVAAADDLVRTLDRAELLQLSLFAPEARVAVSLDRLVRSGAIDVPRGDVRRTVTTRRMPTGAFKLRPELGSHGVRFRSDDRGFALLRLRNTLDCLYLRDGEKDVEELDWQLRTVAGEDVEERLEMFFHDEEPRRVLERMVVASKSNMLAACTDVGVEDPEQLSDDELIDSIMWKLGFSVSAGADPHVDFWERHERLWALAQSSDLGASRRFLESASPYFSSLEGLLLESLAFTAWALLSDHSNAENPFTYDDEEDRRAGLALMESIAPSPTGASSYSADRVDLANLISGFSALSRHLDACEPDRVTLYQKSESDLPTYHGKSSIKSYLLQSTVLFLDLTAPSRQRILDGLREITGVMANADVSLVRNDYAHYRRNAPDLAKTENALEAIQRAVIKLEALGFCRLLFSPMRVTRDPWGRSMHQFRGPRSYEHTFSRPTRFDWMGLPGLDEPAYLIRAASIGEITEVVRFTPRFPSPYSRMWEGYPARRRRPGLSTSEPTGGFESAMDVPN